MFKDSPEGQTNYCNHKTDNTSGICDKCLAGYVGIDTHMNNKPKEEWDNIFDERFGYFSYGKENKEIDSLIIKHFISTLLQSERQKERERIVGELEEWISNYPHKCGACDCKDRTLSHTLSCKIKKDLQEKLKQIL